MSAMCRIIAVFSVPRVEAAAQGINICCKTPMFAPFIWLISSHSDHTLKVRDTQRMSNPDVPAVTNTRSGASLAHEATVCSSTHMLQTHKMETLLAVEENETW